MCRRFVLATFALAACSRPYGSLPGDTGACRPSGPLLEGVRAVDVLFVVDDSPSMTEEQTALAVQIPHLITVLTTGDVDGDDKPDFPPVTDLHAGAITVNMGVGGMPDVPTCMDDAEFGDDGVLLTAPRIGGPDCAASYPRFLSFVAGDDPMRFARDFTCVALTGTGGCGFEQQLDATLKALLPSDSPVRFHAGTGGHGDDPATNGGFLRDDSLVVVLEITDEDDCSSPDSDLWYPASRTHTGDLNLRCIRYDRDLYPVTRFVEGLRSLRPRSPGLVVYGAITGVPPELVSLADPSDGIDYQRLFADSRMQNTVVEMGGRESLLPACSVPGRGNAAPGIRLARVAQWFGPNGVVQSICQADYGPALDAVIRRIFDALGNICLTRSIARAPTGLVPCDAIEIVPPSISGPVACAEVVGANPIPLSVDADGTAHCLIAQLPVDESIRTSGTAPVGSGWYYDDYSAATALRCAATGSQRIVFTTDATTRPGVTVDLQCAGAFPICPGSLVP